MHSALCFARLREGIHHLGLRPRSWTWRQLRKQLPELSRRCRRLRRRRLLQPPACFLPPAAAPCLLPYARRPAGSWVKSRSTSPSGPADAAAALRRRAAPTTARSCGGGALGAGRLPPPPASAYGGEELRRRASARPASCLGPNSTLLLLAGRVTCPTRAGPGPARVVHTAGCDV